MLASVAGVAAYAAFLLVHDAADGPVGLFDRWLYCSLILMPGVLCVWRAVVVPTERLAWALLGTNLLLWGVGEAYWGAITAGDPDAPYPAVDDWITMASYPFAIAGIAVLLRDRVRRFRRLTWLDGAIAGLTVAALATALVLPTVFDALSGPLLADATTLGYPILDTLLLGFLLGVLVLVGPRLEASWILIAASLAILPIADGLYSYQNAAGTYVEGGLLDLTFPVSATLLGVAAWVPSERRNSTPNPTLSAIATPAGFGLVASAVVIYGYLAEVSAVAVGLASAALLAAIVRLFITYGENRRLLARSLRDPLTGLGNRSALTLDLQEALDETAHGRRALVMFDLNGFKLYNDSFGHPAGDALLRRLARRFSEAVGTAGGAYRIGGDEFCALLSCAEDEQGALVARATAALGERGEAFEITAARGVAVLGDEAIRTEDALQLADRRMYENKAGSRSSARSQAHEVLMGVLRERQPELGTHVDRVAELATALAVRMGIEGEELDVISRAGALHDIGKLAIPDLVLDKPGPLDPEELAFIRDHTVVGGRILHEAPALAPVAELVRSSHERWDGDGYPDGLQAEEIPVGSRIIFVCDAFHAMTTERPYSAALSPAEAVDELRSCSGTQFDPAVVEAFCAMVGPAGTGLDRAAGAATPQPG